MEDRRRIMYFSPGPVKLPDEVIEMAQRELPSYNGTGISMLEMSHRSKHFEEVMQSAEKQLRELLPGSERHKLLFLQGGGSAQFSAIPLNLLNGSTGVPKRAEYVVTGLWSSKAAKEASRYLDVVSCIEPPLGSYTTIPDEKTWIHDPSSAYRYYCSDETVHGVAFHHTPAACDIPLVADMSTDFLSHPIDFGAHAVIFAGAQKSVGTAGVTIVFVRDDMLDRSSELCPSTLNYKLQYENNSRYNTPPIFSIYIVKLSLEWMRNQGGVEEMQRRAKIKSEIIYDVVDNSRGLYFCGVQKKHRSRMTIPIRLGCPEGDAELEKQFVQEAANRGMLSLAAHRSVGGIRVSLYSAITVDEARALANFMVEFEEQREVYSATRPKGS